jgi:hypothetical protein
MLSSLIEDFINWLGYKREVIFSDQTETVPDGSDSFILLTMKLG